jgi:cobalt-zinc-cadmium efflux system membrane fusion protein
MFATVRITTTEKRNAIILPEGAVLREKGRAVVVVEEADHYHVQEVQLGLTGDGITEIVSGLNFGERVVTRGQAQIVTQILQGAGSK